MHSGQAFGLHGTAKLGLSVRGKAKFRKGLYSLRVAESQRREGSASAPGPEYALRLAKVSKVAPLIESNTNFGRFVLRPGFHSTSEVPVVR